MHLYIAGCHLPGIQERRSTCRTLQCLNIWQEDGRNADHLCTHQHLKKDENCYKRKCFFFVIVEIHSGEEGGEFKVATTTKAWIFHSFQIFQCLCQGIGPMHLKQGPICTTVTYTFSYRIFFKLFENRIVLYFTNVRIILFTNFVFFSVMDLKLCLSNIEKTHPQAYLCSFCHLQ